MDLSLLLGVLLAGFRILCSRRGALAWFSPECSTWLNFMSRATYGRSELAPGGDERLARNRRANACAHAIGQLIVLAALRGVYVLLEQPMNSLMLAYPPISSALRIVAARRLCTHLGAFGGISMKPLELWTTTGDAALALVRSRREALERLGDDALPLVRTDASGNVTGTAALPASQAYPADFAKEIADLVERLRL